MSTSLRPIGQISDSIHDLERWRKKRDQSKQHVQELDTAIEYLREYRMLTCEVKAQREALP